MGALFVYDDTFFLKIFGSVGKRLSTAPWAGAAGYTSIAKRPVCSVRRICTSNCLCLKTKERCRNKKLMDLLVHQFSVSDALGFFQT